jgi:hypothetical protein
METAASGMMHQPEAIDYFIGSIWLVVSLWMTVRIWKSSVVGAVLTFIFQLPAIYFLFKYWNDDGRNIRIPFFASLLTCMIYYGLALAFHGPQHSRKKADKQAVAISKPNPEMERWCRENNDAVTRYITPISAPASVILTINRSLWQLSDDAP